MTHCPPFHSENRLWKSKFVLVFVWLMVGGVCFQPSSLFAQIESPLPITIDQQADRVTVSTMAEGESKSLFTELLVDEYKPILFPIMLNEVSLTRHFPIEEAKPGEAKDHPHHKSLWFAHGDVNGVDFWTEKARIKPTGTPTIDDNSVKFQNQWLDGDKLICTDQSTIRFFAGDSWRFIEYHVQLQASESDLTLGDTKEGTFAVRSHPALRLVDVNDQPVGQAINSQGVQGIPIWGKKARWVSYQGTIDDQVFTLTIFDHRQNLRHPTTWQAREYGLIAANPFGLSYFQKAEKGAGDFLIPKNDSLSFHYGVLFHQGSLSPEQIDEWFNKFSPQ